MQRRQPKISYTIWFSQRNGSSLLCEALGGTDIAGKPGEWLQIPPQISLLDYYKASSYQELQAILWQKGMSKNGVFGIKANVPRKEQDPILTELAQLSGINPTALTNFAMWENVFPNGKHVFLTRRNKIRQVVSWWKAIVTQEWHLLKGQQKKPCTQELQEKYNFEALKHLLLETALRESKIQALLEEGNTVPLTIVYEDFIKNYEQTIRSVMAFLGIRETNNTIPEPYFEPLADELSDEWAERFRQELQKDWKNLIW